MPPDEAVNGTESRPRPHYLSLRSHRSHCHLADDPKPSKQYDEQPQLLQHPQTYQQPPQPPLPTLTPKSSRRGLRHIFSRSKLTKDRPELLAAPTRAPSNSPDLRPPFSVPADPRSASNVHIPLTEEPAEILSSPRASSVPRSPSLRRQSQALPAPVTTRKGSVQDNLPRGSLATWEMPQLFKAFPQTLRQATLPTVTMPTEMVLRLHEKSISAVDPLKTEEGNSKDKAKRRHAKNQSLSNLQWTTKIYLLVTSGYLLQYSATGNSDRLPEKVLKLSQTSAAFVTDCIPGKHWVLQVSSTTEVDAATPANESKSFLSKLSMLTGEKRDAANILMVFENPDEMDSWMVTLRGEIEKLGGKRKMSETGLPERPQTPPQTSRVVVVRDPGRFAPTTSRSHSRQGESCDDGDSTLRIRDLQHSRDQSIDDASTTNSIVSQDGRQLDNLRDSNGNRLSFASADRRTTVTSTASSPERSPIAETFSRSSTETCDSHESGKIVDAKPRPNASALVSRRTTLQNAGLFIDIASGSQVPRLHADPFASLKAHEAVQSPTGPVAPNFSVPQSSIRRFSHVRGSSSDSQSPPSPNSGTFASRALRLKPPPVLHSSRPLSMVVDRQSPKPDMPVRPPTADGAGRHGLSPVKERYERHRYARRHSTRSSVDVKSDMTSPRSSIASRDGSVTSPTSNYRTSPRRSRPPVAGLRKASPEVDMRSGRVFKRLPAIPQDMSTMAAFTSGGETARRRSTMGPIRVSSPVPQKEARRVSLNSAFTHRRHSSDETRPASMLPPMPPPPSGPLPALPGRASTPRSDKQKALMNRRSLPQMMPPPAPPPLRDLPPLPHIASLRV